MATWSKDELRKIAEADDLHISPFREDGVTYGTLTWIWSVAVGDASTCAPTTGRALVDIKPQCGRRRGVSSLPAYRRRSLSNRLTGRSTTRSMTPTARSTMRAMPNHDVENRRGKSLGQRAPARPCPHLRRVTMRFKDH